MEEALFLTRFATGVTVVHRRDQLRASKIMQERAFAHDDIDFVWDSVVTDIVGDDSVRGVKVKNLKTGESSELDAGGLFIAIGHFPNTALFEGKLETDEWGYLVVGRRLKNDWDQSSPLESRTSVEGVFAAGDVVDSVYRQAITAAGMGSMAAIDAERWLETQGM